MLTVFSVDFWNSLLRDPAEARSILSVLTLPEKLLWRSVTRFLSHELVAPGPAIATTHCNSGLRTVGWLTGVKRVGVGAPEYSHTGVVRIIVRVSHALLYPPVRGVLDGVLHDALARVLSQTL